MNILIVNDDGINARGIELLVRAAAPYGKLFIVAPKTQQSAVSQGITIHEPLQIDEEPEKFPEHTAWSISGKPADCVKVALEYLRLDIDLVLSGINDGPNLGTDILYSGTVAGATEASIFRIPSIALSTDFGSWEIAEREIDDVLAYILEGDFLEPGLILNVNFQLQSIREAKGIRWTRQGRRIFSAKFRHDNGRYWQEGDWVETENDRDSDVAAVSEGYISITPLGVDRTIHDFSQLEEMQ